MKLTLLVEGETERILFKDLGYLTPYTQHFTRIQVLKPADIGGASRLKGEFKEIAEVALQDNTDEYVFCLIDVYEAPFSYPRDVMDEADPAAAQYSYIKKWMEDQIDPSLRERFFAFPVVMEIETWLLADIQAIRDYLRQPALAPYSAPESIRQPARELRDLLRRHGKEYDKTQPARSLFSKSQAQRVYEDSCPHFEAFIQQLLQVQGITPSHPVVTFAAPEPALLSRLTDLQANHERIWQIIVEAGDMTDAQAEQIDRIEQEISAINLKISLKINAG